MIDVHLHVGGQIVEFEHAFAMMLNCLVANGVRNMAFWSCHVFVPLPVFV